MTHPQKDHNKFTFGFKYNQQKSSSRSTPKFPSIQFQTSRNSSTKKVEEHFEHKIKNSLYWTQECYRNQVDKKIQLLPKHKKLKIKTEPKFHHNMHYDNCTINSWNNKSKQEDFENNSYISEQTKIYKKNNKIKKQSDSVPNILQIKQSKKKNINSIKNRDYIKQIISQFHQNLKTSKPQIALRHTLQKIQINTEKKAQFFLLVKKTKLIS